MWLFKFGNFDRQALPNAKMFSFKSYRFAECNFAVSSARNRFFARLLRRLNVQTNIAHQIETNFGRRVDFGFDNQNRRDYSSTKQSLEAASKG